MLARAGGVLVLRGARDRWRWLCELQAVVACAKSAGERWRRCVGLAGKEAGVFGRDAWAGMSRAGEEAGGAAGCGGMRAWGRAGLAELAAGCGGATGRGHQKFSAKVTRVVSFCRRKFAG